MCFLVTIATHPVLVHVLPAITIDTRFKYSFLACNLNQRWNATAMEYTSSWGNSTQRDQQFGTLSKLSAFGSSELRLWSSETRTSKQWLARRLATRRIWLGNRKWNTTAAVSRHESPSIQQMKQTKIKLVAHVIKSWKQKKADAKRRRESVRLGWTFKSDKKVWPDRYDHVLPSPIAESTQPRINWSEDIGREKWQIHTCKPRLIRP